VFQLADLGCAGARAITWAAVYEPGAAVPAIVELSTERDTVIASIPVVPFPLPLPVNIGPLAPDRRVRVATMPVNSVLVLIVE